MGSCLERFQSVKVGRVGRELHLKWWNRRLVTAPVETDKKVGQPGTGIVFKGPPLVTFSCQPHPTSIRIHSL